MKKEAILVAMLTAVSMLSGCAGAAKQMSQHAKLIKEADEEMVKKCTFIGTFKDSRATLKSRRDEAFGFSQIEIFNKIAAQNGNTVVWKDEQCILRPNSSFAMDCFFTARAYACPQATNVEAK